MSRIVYAWRQLRADRGPLLTIAALILVTSFLATALPRWLNNTDDLAVVAALEAQTSPDVFASFGGPELFDYDVFAQTERITPEIEHALQPVLQHVLGEAVPALVTVAMPVKAVDGVVLDPTGTKINLTPRTLVLHDVPVTYVSGGPPASDTAQAGPFPYLGDAYDTASSYVQRVQVGMSQACATPLAASAGSEYVGLIGGMPAVLVVSGIYEPTDAGSYVWNRNAKLSVPALEFSPNGLAAVNCDVLVTADSIGNLQTALTAIPAGLDVPVSPPYVVHEWGLPVNPRTVDARMSPALLTALNRANTTSLRAPTGANVRLSTSLQRPVQTFLQQQASSHAVIAIGTAGALVIALIVLALAAQLTIARRRAALVLARARGSSVAQILSVVIIEGLLSAGLAGAAGWWLATWLVDTKYSVTLGPILVTILVAAVVLALVACALWVTRGATSAGRENVGGADTSPKRIAAEVAIIAMAVASVLLLRQRGFTAFVVGARLDPLLIAAPILIAVAAALVALRLYPLPLKILGRVLADRPTAVGFLGVARAARTGVTTAAPLLALLVASSFAVFGTTVQNTVHTNQDAVAWQRVGADFRINGADFDPAVDVPRIAAAAGSTADDVLAVRRWTTTLLDLSEGQGKQFTLLMLDPAQYRSFLAGRPIDTDAFQPLVDAPPTVETAVPAVVSPALDRVLTSGSMSSSFRLPAAIAEMEKVAVTDVFPGMSPDAMWAVIRTTDARTVKDLPYWPTDLFVDASTAAGAQHDAAAVRDAVHESQPYTAVISRAEVYDALAKAPLIDASGRAFGWAAIAAGAFCVLAVVLGLVVTAGTRSRFLAYIRTIGLSGRQVRALVALEVVPLATFSILAGLLLGLFIPRAILPAVDLRPFTGAADAPPVLVPYLIVLGLGVALFLVVALAVWTVAAIDRRRGLGAILRVGEER